MSCSHNRSDHKHARIPASLNFSNLPSLNLESWLKELSNSDVYRNREAGTKYGKAAAGKIVDALKLISMYPGGDKKSFYQSFQAKIFDKKIKSQNIIALSHPKNKRAPEIIISAYYNRVNFCKSMKSSKNCFVKTDNAAGTIAAIKVAALLKRHSPNTSFAITLWGAEELKNAGSEYFSQTPSFDLSRSPLLVNLDLNNEANYFISDLETQGSHYQDEIENIKQIFSHKVKKEKFTPKESLASSVIARSDRKSFASNGYNLPTLFISNHNGLNTDTTKNQKLTKKHSLAFSDIAQNVFKVIDRSNSRVNEIQISRTKSPRTRF